MNIHQTKAHADFLRSIGWIIEEKIIRGTRVYAFVRELPVLSISVLKLQRICPKLIDEEWIEYLEKKYHVYETLVEIDELDLYPKTIDLAKFMPAADFMLTTKTRIIDLSQSEDLMLAAMKPKTRYNIHVASKHALFTSIWSTKVIAGNDDLFEMIYGLLRTNAARIKMLLLPKQWIKKQFGCFGNDGFVIGVFDAKKRLVNAAVFYCSDTTCSYNHNGSTEIGRRFMGPTLAVWEGIKEGKRRGSLTFDFDGVFDERYPHTQKRFQGFGRFKEGFGGNELYFQPMYRKMRNPLSLW